ncbi:MAG TPA: hypothetical protein VNQ32_15680 [Steroidobacteraceae bacterium]|nr:hypothetical protein [Steroidobacteraceae bacterium]
MSDRQAMESRIDAALAAQLHVPRLDRQFDAAVWRRIEKTGAEEPGRSNAAPVRTASVAARWLRAGNAAGLLVTMLLLGYFGLQQFGGSIAPGLAAGPAADSGLPWMSPSAWAITIAALAFGLGFTGLGKWLR